MKNRASDITKNEDVPKFLANDNAWNKDGLRRARTNKDGEEIICTATKIPLYYEKENGSRIPLESYGTCCNCKNVFHASYLYATDTHSGAPWPVVYRGRFCIDCFKLDPGEWEEPPEDWPNVFRGL